MVFHQLRYVCAIAETGSFSRAACTHVPHRVLAGGDRFIPETEMRLCSRTSHSGGYRFL